MTARNRSRTFLVGAAVAALLAPLAIVAAFASPASAAPGKPHEVYIYKVEKHVTMSGEFPDQYLHDHVFCDPGDIALDGMWRVDHVDQAQPPEFVGDERDVVFTASYGDTADQSKWHFRAHNYADGDAQIKLFATCIRGSVEQAYGHTHGIVVRNLPVDSTNTALPVDTDPAFGANEWDFNGSCNSTELAVAPGFNFSGDDFRVREYRSWLSPDYLSWHWAFLVQDPGADVSLYLKCLQIKTATTNGHAHNLFWSWRPDGFNGFHGNLTSGNREYRLNCDDNPGGASYQDYKAAVGAFWLTNPWHTWFMGMDPRPKQRAFRFWWDGSGSSDYYLAALCIRARTGKQVAP
ncbi:hypothetical protein [Nocardioides aquiterrae]|uniref:Uncharacterized protein n=1 Tax=Nocardioides aquiterrae TaxID=203799 RepID=A0ABP4F7Z5_9ACTN